MTHAFAKARIAVVAFVLCIAAAYAIALMPTQAQAVPASSVTYKAHVQTKGWMGWVEDGAAAGVTGQKLRTEAFQVKLEDPEYSGSIQYRAHVQSKGWMSWAKDGKTAGTTGQGLRVEAIQVKLTGEMAENYDVYYRVHAQKFGWMGWAKNGASAGSQGCRLRIEAIQIRLVEKGGAAPGTTSGAFKSMSMSYTTHVQRQGWQSYVSQGTTSGTTGKSLRVEAFRVKLDNNAFGGSVNTAAYIQGDGWTSWLGNNKVAGTTGKGKRIEALQIKLTGEMASRFDVYYRVHVQGNGWMGWAKNGAKAGTKGYGKRIEALQVKLVSKGAGAPGSTKNPYADYADYVKAKRDALDLHEDYRSVFDHGPKNAAQTKYIVLHDTEGGGTAQSVINYWAGNGNRVASHFIVQRDGEIWQCVPMDRIAHHAGYGNKGHNKKFGVTDESRDDKKGTTWVSSYLPDYGMNSYSIGIEMIHQGNQSYTSAQLKSLDKLIAYIDAYYGKECTIIDHKMWRIGNSDTSKAFATYLANYRDHRTHN